MYAKDLKAWIGQAGLNIMNHDNISYIKSGIRIVAGLFLIFAGLQIVGILLILAELLGIAEELV